MRPLFSCVPLVGRPEKATDDDDLVMSYLVEDRAFCLALPQNASLASAVAAASPSATEIGVELKKMSDFYLSAGLSSKTTRRVGRGASRGRAGFGDAAENAHTKKVHIEPPSCSCTGDVVQCLSTQCSGRGDGYASFAKHLQDASVAKMFVSSTIPLC